MGNNKSNECYVNFEWIKSQGIYNILINTMDVNHQDCLIKNTIEAKSETEFINNLIAKRSFNTLIVLYGKNYSDKTIEEKYNQLTILGFKNIKVYLGGMFEWLILQDIFGKDEFQTTNIELNILKYKPNY